MNNINKLKIAIQGGRGAFHEAAARHYFGENKIEIIPANSFEELIDITENQTDCDAGVMAIENTNAGSILHNYHLLNHSMLNITGEIHLRIAQHLMAQPGQTIDQIHTVYSHPVAIAQCRRFFDSYPNIKLVATSDTALSAKKIADEKANHVAAIASSLAADLYQLEILESHIESHKENYTRFLILNKQKNNPSVKENNKVSIGFALEHETGSLLNVLKILKNLDANMTKIQSFPIIGQAWRYRFFIDYLLVDQNKSAEIIKELSVITTDLQILGIYKNGGHYE